MNEVRECGHMDMAILRDKHRDAVIAGNHEKAARIRNKIREAAKRHFDKGETLESVY